MRWCAQCHTFHATPCACLQQIQTLQEANTALTTKVMELRGLLADVHGDLIVVKEFKADLLTACRRALNDRLYREWPDVAELLMAAILKAGGSLD